jgi:transketolase
MRKIFASYLIEKMRNDKDIVLLTGDLGYGLFDQIRLEFPDQFYNFGSSELSMVAAACGMALEGKKTYVYSITPFLLWRPFEVIRNYIDKESIPVKLIGGGRDEDYGYLGFSHWANDDLKFMNSFHNVKSFKPENNDVLIEILEQSLNSSNGFYINLKK